MIVLEILTAFFLLVGAILALLAAVGMVRLPDTFLRMQASAKASTLGLACLLVGAAFQLTDVSSIIRLGAIAAFVMLTAPLSAHVVARATLRRGTRLWSGSVLNEYEYEPESALERASSPPSTAPHSAGSESTDSESSAPGSLHPPPAPRPSSPPAAPDARTNAGSPHEPTSKTDPAPPAPEGGPPSSQRSALAPALAEESLEETATSDPPSAPERP